MSVATVDDLKVYLNKTSSADDAELQDMLDAAIEMVEGLVGPIGSATVTETHYARRGDTIVLKQAPVQALTSVSGRYYPGATATAYLLTDYLLEPETGVVRLVNGFHFTGDYTFTYTVGRAIVPAAVRLATLIIAGHLWNTQRGVSPTALQDPDAAGYPMPAGYAMPNRARELLAPFARSPRVA